MSHGYVSVNNGLKKYFEDNCKHMGVEYHVNPNFSESDFNATERKDIVGGAAYANIPVTVRDGPASAKLSYRADMRRLMTYGK